MIKNYLKIAWRNLWRNKTFSAINIFGLALGMACSLLILLWVKDEYSVDSFHANGKYLYQVYERQYYDGKIDATYLTQGLLANELKKVIPEVQYASSLEQNAPYPYMFRAGDKMIKMDGSFAGADFFKMFSYPLLAGTIEAATNTPGGISISRKMAELFFGSPEKAIGKTIRFENKEDVSVTAVFENLPVNSSQQFDFLRCWQDYAKNNAWVNSWGSSSPYTLVQLRADADAAKTGDKIKKFISLYTTQTKENHIEVALQPYPQKYLHSIFRNGEVDGGRIEYVRLFSLIAIFILLIACINFMNLSTARSVKRAKEVGIRKVIGALRSTLMRQFIGEAMLLTFCSIIIAVILVSLLLPAFNDLTGKQLILPLSLPSFWVILFGLLTVTGMVAGSYPAVFLSSLNPVRVLKGSLKFSGGATFFRKGLVIFQFALSILLIVGMVVIYRQMEYVQTKNLGYNRSNLVYIPIEGNFLKKFELFKQEAGKMPGIRAISKMKESPTVIGHRTGDIRWIGKDPNLVTSFADAVVGYDFIKTMDLKLKDGRDFSKGFGTDSVGFMLNETAANKINYQDPVGKTLWWGNREGKIIGVLKDFHFNSMHEAIEPLIIRMDENQNWGTILVRIEAGKTKQTLFNLEKICKELNPGYPFTYQFSDAEYAKLYKSEQMVSKLSDWFAFLAILISCLGLFGLATFVANQRTKEIGVRKVMGASAQNIIVLLSTYFLKPVAIAMVIACPIAWYVMNKWLQSFAYKIIIDWRVFAAAGVLTVFIALLTVSYQSIKAAFVNPVKSLKDYN